MERNPLTEEEKEVVEKPPEVKEKDRFLTPKRPYDYDALLKATEKELGDMMKEMREKIRGR